MTEITITLTDEDMTKLLPLFKDAQTRSDITMEQWMSWIVGQYPAWVKDYETRQRRNEEDYEEGYEEGPMTDEEWEESMRPLPEDSYHNDFPAFFERAKRNHFPEQEG